MSFCVKVFPDLEISMNPSATASLGLAGMKSTPRALNNGDGAAKQQCRGPNCKRS